MSNPKAHDNIWTGCGGHVHLHGSNHKAVRLIRMGKPERVQGKSSPAETVIAGIAIKGENIGTPTQRFLVGKLQELVPESAMPGWPRDSGRIRHARWS